MRKMDFAFCAGWIYSKKRVKMLTCGVHMMGELLVRMKNGSYKSSRVPDEMVVYLFNSGTKSWTIGPSISESSPTGETGTRSSSTDKKPLPFPPM